MHAYVVLKPCKITNTIYFFFFLGGHYPLFLEVGVDEKEKMFLSSRQAGCPKSSRDQTSS